MAVEIKNNSRLRFSRLVETGGFTYWDTFELPTIPIQTDDIQYTVRSTDRIDLLANRFYGDPVLWWVIAVANDMEFLPNDLLSSEVIRIPAPRYVAQQLFGRKALR